MKPFNPNAAATPDSGIFGLPTTEAEASLVYLPVPWEVTTSYRAGTAQGPRAILEASHQVDLYDLDVIRPYEAGLFMLPESSEIRGWNEKARHLAEQVIEVGGEIEGNPKLEAALREVNEHSAKMNEFTRRECLRLLKADKIVGVVGGDHSVPFGALQAIAEKHPTFGILHLDAHSDTRHAYEGFTWSHASIMHNVLEHIPQMTKLIQVGIRDMCEEEAQYISSRQKDRVHFFSDRDLSRRKMEGTSWGILCREMVSLLPNEVWLSFDIDGLDPRFCPHTGTPVPGGLDFQEANFLMACVVQSGRKIIGFDLNEVAPHPSDSSDEWDANVGARLLYKMSGWTLASQSKAQLQL